MKIKQKVFQGIELWKYWLNKVSHHSLHSPFFFGFYHQVIAQKKILNPEIESIRKDLKKDESLIRMNDLGAGSLVSSSKNRSIATIARHGMSSPRFSSFLSCLIDFTQSKNIIELGTSLGINSLYMSQNPNVKLYTFEGDQRLVNLAHENFSKLNRKNIRIVEGNIDHTLSTFLTTCGQVDLAYIDANHRYTPTINYFKQILAYCDKSSIIVFDDIHWSLEMKRAWIEILSNKQVTASIDLFDAGIVFFEPNLSGFHEALSF